MKKITPYPSLQEAKEALDNGGRFYNLLTKADDGVISKAELGKVAGVFNDKQKMMLFLTLAISELHENDRNVIVHTLSEDLRTLYHQHKPQELLPSEVATQGDLSANVILEGIPKLIESKSDFNGFIMIPTMAGSVMTFIMVPIIDEYDVYELKDEASAASFTIAHTKRSAKLPEKKIKVAGVLKELKAKEDEEKASKKFLEAVYYVEG